MYPVEFKGHTIFMTSSSHPSYNKDYGNTLHCEKCGIYYEEYRGKYCIHVGEWQTEDVHTLPSCDEYKMRDALE